MPETAVALKGKWGNPRDAQVRAEYDGSITRKVPKSGIWRGAYTVEESIPVSLNTANGDEVGDELNAWRYFKYRCGLLKAVEVLSPSAPRVLLMLDGYDQMWLPIRSLKIHLSADQELLQDGPMAEVEFQGHGPRYGRLRVYQETRVTLWFKDQEQLRKHVVATTVSDPPLAEKEATRIAYEESDDSWPLVAGLAGLCLGATLFSD